LLLALVGGGAVAIYLARSNRDSIIAGASKEAVSVVRDALAQQKGEIADLTSQLVTARDRITVLEGQHTSAVADHTESLAIIHQCRLRIVHLCEAIVALGGTVDDTDETGDAGDDAA
jgi:hypothetical protein